MTARPDKSAPPSPPRHNVFTYIMYHFFYALCWVLMKLIYRTRVVGLENIPRTGPGLIVSNHMSMLDGLFLYLTMPRRVRFLVWAPYVNKSRIGWILKLGHVIPIAEDGSARDLITSLKLAQDALAAGELVGIFPEGAICRNGNMMPFKRGMEHILKKVEVPIIPSWSRPTVGQHLQLPVRQALQEVAHEMALPDNDGLWQRDVSQYACLEGATAHTGTGG
jgi:1-acyl-sn-glycerol-3-phosphate acyltransferase